MAVGTGEETMDGYGETPFSHDHTVVHVIGNMDPAHGGAQKVIDNIRRCSGQSGRYRHEVFAALQRSPGFEGVHNAGLGRIEMPFRLRRQLQAFLEDKQASLVHVHSPVVGAWARRAARNVGVPIVTTLHNYPSRYKSIIGSLERRTITWDKAVTCVSEGVRRDFQEWAPANRLHVTTIHNGIDMQGFANVARHMVDPEPQATRTARTTILGYGRLHDQKGFDVAIKAIGLLRDRAYPVEFLLVGEGPERGALERLVERLDLGDAVRFAGSTARVADYLKQADVAVFASRWEGFGLTLVESVAAGLPVVATNLEPYKEIYPECAHFVPIDDEKALADELVKVLDSLDEENEKARSAAASVQAKFSAQNMTAAYERLYDQVLNVG